VRDGPDPVAPLVFVANKGFQASKLFSSPTNSYKLGECVQKILHSQMRLRNGLHGLNQIVLPVPGGPIIRKLIATASGKLKRALILLVRPFHQILPGSSWITSPSRPIVRSGV